MDFCKLLHTAQKNDKNSSGGTRYYSTKFEPPKKIKKESKQLSQNIKKFLAKKEAEEQKKNEEAQKKKEELLALRAQDKKATRRVNVMLKRTKSANQSVIEDAVDKTHTAVTLAGPEQPDEDDYGYVSQEASAFYEKMMEKYSKMPEEKKFDPFKKKVSTNLSSTKDRVKAALEREREEAMQPHRRKRKRKEGDEEKSDSNKHTEEEKDVPVDTKESVKVKPKPRPAPPPMSFTDLLKIAEKKQFEPIVIEQKPKEEEKLLTKRQKKEQEKEREWRERREARQKELENNEKLERTKEKGKHINKINNSSTNDNNRESSKILEKQLTKPLSKENSDRPRVSNNGKLPSAGQAVQKSSSDNSQFRKPLLDSKVTKTNKASDYKLPNPSSKSVLNKNSSLGSASSSKSSQNSSREEGMKKGVSVGNEKLVGKSKDLLHKGKPKEFPPRDLMPKPKQFPPADVRGIKRKKPIMPNKGRILDDSEEEYDSELDDFIDDGPEEDNNYSSYIKEIFGYDKSRYRDRDDDVDDMESSFAQQMKEEVISTKIGIMEDLEDIKLEEEHKRRKAIMKKKMKR